LSQRRLHQKQQLFTLIAELHRAGITSANVIGELLGISGEYARQIREKLGLRPPRNALEALEQLDTQLRRKLESWESPTKTRARV
jgi:hypothetical protein